ncbi:MAG: hypothetical protein FD126_1887 [Elusimicrobia bacterium]|nr:MAG: hypothetical protein FD126_1887 [Elusimicrobiota bacterium]
MPPALGRSFGLALLAALLASCQAAFAPLRPRWPAFPDGHFMHVGQFLQVTGTGRPAKTTLSQTQERSEARDAALVDAWGRLKAYLEALPYDRTGSVGAAAKANAALAQSLEQVIFKAEIVETRYDGSMAAVVVRVDKDALNRMLDTEFRQ